jgi:hypothetical protein
MRWLLTLLLLAGTAFADYAPDNMKFLVSLRSPSIGEQTDFLFGGEVEWQFAIVSAEWERENSCRYINYEIISGNEGQKGNRWQFALSTKASQARDINRQKAVCRYKLWFLGVGVAGVAESYDFNRMKGVNDFRVPLFGCGYIAFATNYSYIHVWDMKLEIKDKSDNIVKPFIAGKFYQANDDLDWQVLVGMEICID